MAPPLLQAGYFERATPEATASPHLVGSVELQQLKEIDYG